MLLLAQVPVLAQQASILGKVTSDGNAIEDVQLVLKTKALTSKTDSAGLFLFAGLSTGKYELRVSKVGFVSQTLHIKLDNNEIKKLDISLQKNEQALNEIVITGTMKEVKRVESPVPVEVYSAAFFKKNPTPSLFDAMQNMNGVRPSVNCNVCNTGDIRINGMEGPYTMVLIDGMPIVSSLGSVYGLFGIPNHLIERVEVVKGPASSLYGSEAVGGLINVITKKVGKKNTFAFEMMTNSWLETNIDASSTIRVNSKISTLLGANLFQYSSPKDVNKDLFTDIALQKRFTIFNTWSVQRKFNRPFTIAARYLNEDRWGGEMRWKQSDKGSDQIYGESIQTNRTEFLLNSCNSATAIALYFIASLVCTTPFGLLVVPDV
jgi:outer membrane receptor for ferrienterochelin and colicins